MKSARRGNDDSPVTEGGGRRPEQRRLQASTESSHIGRSAKRCSAQPEMRHLDRTLSVLNWADSVAPHPAVGHD